ncbi:hypothetical protein PO909_016901 [Leuciscus waleckii]
MPSQPSSPASSSDPRQFLFPFAAVSRQPLSSFSRRFTPWLLCGVNTPQASRTTAPSGCSDPLALPPATDPVTPSRPDSALAPPSLSSIWDHRPLASPGSLNPPAPPRSYVTMPTRQTCEPFAVCHLSTSTSPSGSALPQALSCSGSTSDLRYPCSTSGVPLRPPEAAVSCLAIGSLSALLAPSPPALSPSVIPMASSMRFTPWLLARSTPPWGSILAGLWISIRLLLLVSHWIHPPSTPPWTLFCSPDSASFSFTLRPSPEPHPSLLSWSSYGARTRLFGRGRSVTYVLCFPLHFVFGSVPVT